MRNAYTLRTLATCALLCLAGSAALAQPTAIVDAKDASSTTRLRVDVYGGILAPGVFNDGSPEKSGSLPQVEGSGTRMMWYPGKAAFRAGGINGT
ncbi:MAG TPA: hypothetical protein VD948_09870, partial [Rhodothermales bacterium]|nr:hypothetical protein [Rhodothermales bacterium]